MLDAVERFVGDLRFGLRTISNSPGFSILAVLTLALGIAATTVTFSILYAVVLRPLPFGDPERLVAIWTQTPQTNRLPNAAANHSDLKNRNTVFEDIALLQASTNYNLTGDHESELLSASRIASNLFPLLKVTPVLGRGFTDVENQPGNDRVVILSDAIWRRRFASDQHIIGKTVRLDNESHIIVGVMGPDFRYPASSTQLWKPLTVNPDDFRTRTGFGHLAVARLKPGITVERAQSEVSQIALQLAAEFPPNKGVRFSVTPLRSDIAGVAQKPLFVLVSAALGLLMIGCCNLLNLLIARELSRSHETALRSALGATRARLFLQSGAELLPILIIGSIVGVLAAREGIRLMIPLLPATLPRSEEIGINLPVLLFSASVLVVSSVLVVLLPALRAGRKDLLATLREGSRSLSGSRSKTTIRHLLVVGQIAMTLMLLTAAGLLIRTFLTLQQLNAGFHSENVLTLRLSIPEYNYRNSTEVASVCKRILDQVRSIPGVAAAGLVNRLPLGGPSGLSTIEFERANNTPGELEGTDDTTTSSDYFKAMGIPLLKGRSFSEHDVKDSPPVVIIDEQVAQRAWSGEDPIGKRVRSSPDKPWAQVIGVVGHIRHEDIETDRRLQIYWNYHQRTRANISLIVRASGDERTLVKPVLDSIKSIDAELPAYAVRTMNEVRDKTLGVRWFNTLVVALFAGSSVLLAMIGIYGVIAWSVRMRTSEIGIRIALGAQRRTVLALVLKNAFTLAAAGIVLGICGSLILGRFIRSLLFGVTPADPLTLIAVPLLLILAAIIASWIPALRATRVDPMVALRQE